MQAIARTAAAHPAVTGQFFQFYCISDGTHFARPFEDNFFYPAGHSIAFSAKNNLVQGKTQAAVFTVDVECGLDLFQAFNFYPLAGLKVKRFGWRGLGEETFNDVILTADNTQKL